MLIPVNEPQAVNQPENINQNNLPEMPHKKRKWSGKVIFVLVLLGCAVLTASAFILIQYLPEKKPNASAQPIKPTINPFFPSTSNPSITVSPTNSPADGSVELYKNKTHLNIVETLDISKDDSDKVKNLFESKETDALNDIVEDTKSVKASAFSSDKIAYVYNITYTYKKNPLNPEDPGIKVTKSTVYLYDTKDKSSKVIYELDRIKDRNDYYFYDVKDVYFSDDGRTLYITTATSVLYYDVASYSLSVLFSRDEESQRKLGIYALYAPRLSPDKSILTLTQGYYEGSSTVFYDLNAKKILNFTLGSYSSGDIPISWYKKMLLVEETNNYNDKTKQYQNGSFYLIDPRNPANRVNLFELNMDMFLSAKLIGSNLYYVDETSVKSGQYAYNNVGAKMEVESSFQTLYKYEIESNKREEILKIDATRWSGVEDKPIKIGTFIEHDVNGKNLVLVEIFEGDLPKYYAADKDDKDVYSLHEIKLDK